MKAFTEKTGWVPVIRDNIDHLCMWLAVPGYTFYGAHYTEITAFETDEGRIIRRGDW